MTIICVGDDWAEDHHDVYLQDESGRRLAARRFPEGLTGIAGLHELIAEHAADPSQVIIGIETDRGLWVQALLAAGYQVYAVNPLSVPLPRPACSQWGQIGCRRRETAGRSGAYRPAQPPAGGR